MSNYNVIINNSKEVEITPNGNPHSVYLSSPPYLNFEPYVAPTGFDRQVQPVDIFDVFQTYWKTDRTAKYIYTVKNTAIQTATMYGTSQVYGYELSGISYQVSIPNVTSTPTNLPLAFYTGITVVSTTGFPDSGKITMARYANTDTSFIFTYTSKDSTHFYGTSQYCQSSQSSGQDPTNVHLLIEWPTDSIKRYVITNNTSMVKQRCMVEYVNNSEWLYCGDLINQISTGNPGGGYSVCKWIHIHRLDNIEFYGYCDHHTNGSLEGNLYLSRTPTIIGGNYGGDMNDPVNGSCFGLVFNGKINLTGTLHIPGNIIRIGTSGLNNNGFTKIEFEEGLKILDDYAIGSNYVTSISSFPSTLFYIGTNAFRNLGIYNGSVNFSLTIPSTITIIRETAFTASRFTSFTSTSPNYIIEDNIIYDVRSGVTHPQALHSDFLSTGVINLKTGTTKILDYCFWNSLRSGSLNLLNTVTEIKTGGFQECHYLVGDLNTNNVTTIGNAAFYYCQLFTGITLGTSLTYIGDGGLQYLFGITSNLVIPDNVTHIGSQAFRDWRSTGTLTLPNSPCTLFGYTFYNCRFTGTLNIPSNIITIQESTFASCEFSDVVSSNSNYPVFDHVLYDIKTVGQIKANYSPKGYSGTLTLSGNTTHILDYCFNGNSLRTGTLTIPITVISIAQFSFSNCVGFVGNLELPINTNITSSWTFSNCSGFWGSLIIQKPDISIYFNTNTTFTGMSNIGRTSGGIELPTGYTSTYLDFSFSNYLSLMDSGVTLNKSILNITNGTVGSPKTVNIGITNKTRLLTYYPSAETNANARYIYII